MADQETYIVRAWAEGDAPPAGTPPLRLLRRDTDGTETELASHDTGISIAPSVSHEGEDHPFAGLLDQSQLRKDPLMLAAGRELWNRLAPGAMGPALEALPIPARVVLDFRSADLFAFPWELLRLDDDRLFLDDRQPWCLGTAEPAVCPRRGQGQVPLSLPLRVLLVVGTKPGDPKVQGDVEIQTLEDGLHACRSILLEVLERPTPTKIEKTLEAFRPHVFHFIGHGKASKTKSIFYIEGAGGVAEAWDSDRIRQLFRKLQVPRFVLLNACDTGAATPESSWNLGRTFLDLGVGALLTMQTEILGAAAVKLSDHLYCALAEGHPLDRAATLARSEVAFEGAPLARANWPVPRLVVRGAPEKVVAMTTPPTGPCSIEAEEDFVQRWPQRTAVCRNLCPLDSQSSRLVVLAGPKSSGKSALLKILGETWANAGHAALYVNLKKSPSELASLVSRFREAAVQVGLDDTPLATIDTHQADSEDVAKQIHAALAKLAKLTDRPLMVLLDGLEDWEDNILTRIVLPLFLVPYWDPGEPAKVWMVAAMRDGKAPDFRWNSLAKPYQPVRVEEFDRQEWRRAATQFIRWHQGQLDEGSREDFGQRALQYTFLDEDKPNLPERYSPNLLMALRFLRQSVSS